MIAALEAVLLLMQQHQVRCVVIGGWAAILTHYLIFQRFSKSV
jgi:hypothetical protein